MFKDQCKSSFSGRPSPAAFLDFYDVIITLSLRHSTLSLLLQYDVSTFTLRYIITLSRNGELLRNNNYVMYHR